MNKPNAICRYIDLLFQINKGTPIPRIWLSPNGAECFTYNPTFGAYCDDHGHFLSSLFFEKQMLVPNIWFYKAC